MGTYVRARVPFHAHGLHRGQLDRALRPLRRRPPYADDPASAHLHFELADKLDRAPPAPPMLGEPRSGLWVGTEAHANGDAGEARLRSANRGRRLSQGRPSSRITPRLELRELHSRADVIGIRKLRCTRPPPGPRKACVGSNPGPFITRSLREAARNDPNLRAAVRGRIRTPGLQKCLICSQKVSPRT
jgi:hypothetical protein